MKYRKLKLYKYQLTENFFLQTDVAGYDIEHPFVFLNKNGYLIVNKGYCWDGPSGPAIDTKVFVEESLHHDVFYQLLREGYLPQKERKKTDKFLYKRLIKRGMWRIRATWIYLGLRLFGKSSAKPGRDKGELNK